MTLSLTIQLITLLLAFGAAIGSLYNAFFIQKPWFKDYNNRKSPPKDYEEPSWL